ncbi:hypothetical protein [Treponema sp.]|uniref:hypothetical protein n=1 Tax=Treponema sp. TaxID=166 RepID=UPI00298EB324|nr:hypothetical protein [Treponema sp.]
MKKLFLGLVAAAMVACFAGCDSPSSSSASGWVEKTVWWNEESGNGAKFYFSESAIDADNESANDYWERRFFVYMNPGFTGTTSVVKYGLDPSSSYTVNGYGYTTSVEIQDNCFISIVLNCALIPADIYSLTKRATDDTMIIYSFNDGTTLAMFYDSSTPVR